MDCSFFDNIRATVGSKVLLPGTAHSEIFRKPAESSGCGERGGENATAFPSPKKIREDLRQVGFLANLGPHLQCGPVFL